MDEKEQKRLERERRRAERAKAKEENENPKIIEESPIETPVEIAVESPIELPTGKIDEKEQKRLDREKRRAERAKAKEDTAPKDVKALEKEIKQLKRELKREARAAKSGEAFEKELLAQRKEFDNITDTNMVYAITDKELHVEKVSRAFVDMFSYQESNILNEKYGILIHNQDYEKFYTGCEYVATHGEEAWGIDMMMQRADGSVLYTYTYIYPLMESGVLKGFTFVSEDISTKRLLHKLQIKMLSLEKYDETTLEFVSSTSAAVLDTISYKISAVVKIIVGFMFLFLTYAISFDIDELSRGSGKFIPTAKVQHVKNQEGGIISAIYVQEGDSVKKGQILIKLNPLSYQTKLDENRISIAELKAKQARLKAETMGLPMEEIKCDDNCDPRTIELERHYFLSNKQEFNKNISKQYEQLNSKKSALEDAKNKYSILEENYLILAEEYDLKKELSKQKIITKFELRTLERSLNDLLSSKRSAKEVIIQSKAQIQEIKNSIEEARLTFKNKAASQYNETSSEILRLEETKKSLEDILKRTVIRSPVDGVVKELFVHTIGTSVSPSFELTTVVPNTYEMVAEVKMSPTEIAKIHIGQSVKLKVTAFDYSIYGDLEGKIINITPDTIIDKDTGESNYLIYIKTKRNYLHNNEKYKIKVGMMVNADILVGKKSIMAFLLKPILKTTQRD